jgi:UDP-GlcNAc:undecaprenyl-phosphate GlcNAc-1-phosphate transferase
MALAAALLLVGISRPLARRVGAVAQVSPDRWHKGGTIPRLGGLGILLAMIWSLPWQEFLVLSGYCVVGIADDLLAFSAARKAALLVIPSLGVAALTGNAWIGASAWIAANAVNLLDHADGLAAIAVATSCAIAGGPLGTIGAVATLGFLVYNFPPAKTFLGDGGSLMLGAFLVLVWWPRGPTALVLGLAIPLIDASFVTGRRLVERRRLWVGGLDHTGHALLRLGMPPRALVGLYGISAAFSASAALLVSR